MFFGSEHREGLGRLERPRLVFPYRKHWFSSLMYLVGAKKVEHFKGTGLFRQRNVKLSARISIRLFYPG